MEIKSETYTKDLDGDSIEVIHWFYLTDTYMDRKFHNENGPAVVEKTNGIISYESYYFHGKHHRVDGPAIIWYRDGRIETENYYIDNKPHRIDGPAIIMYDIDTGEILEAKYFVNGKNVTDIVELNKEVLNDSKLMKILS